MVQDPILLPHLFVSLTVFLLTYCPYFLRGSRCLYEDEAVERAMLIPGTPFLQHTNSPDRPEATALSSSGSTGEGGVEAQTGSAA